ncbi:MAG: ATP-binding protein [Candidatus Thiodiazotropha sp.]
MLREIENLRDLLHRKVQEAGAECWIYPKLMSAVPEIEAYLDNAVAVPYTSHNWAHSETVEKNCVKLVNYKLLLSLNEIELYILTMSIWLHDAGMVPKNASDSFEKTRDAHPRRIHDLIKNNKLEFVNVDKALRGYIAEICLNHCQNSPDSLRERVTYRGKKIRLQLLSSLLRLSDICDISDERIPTSIYNTYNFPKTSQPFWDTHMAIHDVDAIEKNDETIITLEAMYSGAREKILIDNAIAYIENEIYILAPFFAREGWILSKTIKPKVDEERPEASTEFETLSEGVYNLLCEYMYESKDVFIREMVQNCIDSHKQRKSKQSGYDAIINITVYGREIEGEFIPKVLRISDNGIGMDQDDVRKYLLTIGNAISRSSEVMQRLASDGDVEELIGEFGIGFLTVFPVSEFVEIYTRKKGFFGLAIKIEKPFLAGKDSTDHLVTIDRYESLEKPLTGGSDEEFCGTIIIIHLNESGSEIDIEKAISTYCRNITIPICYSKRTLPKESDYLHIHTHSLDNDPTDTCKVLKVRYLGGSFPEPYRIDGRDEGPIIEYHIGYNNHEVSNNLIVTQEGIFVENCPNLIIEGLKGISGEINLRAKSIDLIAARNRIKRNKKYDKLKLLLEKYFLKLVSKIVHEYPLGERVEESNILGFLNWICANNADDKTFLRSVFKEIEGGIKVICDEHGTYKRLSDIRGRIERNGITDVVLQVIQKDYVSHIPVSEIQGYVVAVVPSLYTVRYGLSSDNKKMVITVQGAHQPGTLPSSHIQHQYLTGMFYRQYFKLLGVGYREFKIHEFQDMITEKAKIKGHDAGLAVRLLNESNLLPFADKNVQVRSFIGTDSRYINLDNRNVEKYLTKYITRKKAGLVTKTDESLIRLYLEIISLQIREAVDSIESTLEREWFRESDI